MKENKPLVSVQELEALMGGWGESLGPASVDKFFPLRMYILLFFCLCAITVLLFFTDSVAADLSNSIEKANDFKAYIYFRGWFILVLTLVVFNAYRSGQYVAIIFGVILIIASMNFISDLFIVYADRLKNITPYFTLMLLGRLIALWFLFLGIKNVKRLPEKGQRFDILLPFRRIQRKA